MQGNTLSVIITLCVINDPCFVPFDLFQEPVYEERVKIVALIDRFKGHLEKRGKSAKYSNINNFQKHKRSRLVFRELCLLVE